MTVKLFLILIFQFADTPEQRALDYFMTSIFPIEYTSKPRPKFTGTTETIGTSFEIFSSCFKDSKEDEKIWEDLSNNKLDNLERQRLNIEKWKKNLKKTGTNEIKVYRSTKVTDRYYVNVTINYKSNSDCYFVELDKELNVVRHCKTQLIY